MAVRFDQAALVDVMAKDLAGHMLENKFIPHSFTVGQKQGAPLLGVGQVVNLLEGRKIFIEGVYLLIQNTQSARLIYCPERLIALRVGQFVLFHSLSFYHLQSMYIGVLTIID